LTEISRHALILALIGQKQGHYTSRPSAFSYLVTILQTERVLCEVQPKPENIGRFTHMYNSQKCSTVNMF